MRVATMICLLGTAALAGTVRVRDADALRRALAQAKAGTTILVEAGNYRGGFVVRGLRGTKGAPIVIRSADPRRPAVIKGGASGLQLSSVCFVEVRDLVLEGATGNGLNIDDGGTITAPAHHVVLAGLTVRKVGPRGNRDGIKLSGVDDFRVEGCVIEEWGSGGSGIDMVGCHSGEIVGCTFRRGGASGIQAKGGSRAVAVRRCRFESAGQRAINLGGSTGAAYFRPKAPGYEAKDIVVEDCTIVGSDAAVAFVGTDGATVRHCTIVRPRRWVLRILQESRGADFLACRNGRFSDNLVVFRANEIRRIVNVGAGTEPATFAFERNFWFCSDAPDRSRPELPVAEKAGVYGKDPAFRDADGGDYTFSGKSPARGHGVRPDP